MPPRLGLQGGAGIRSLQVLPSGSPAACMALPWRKSDYAGGSTRDRGPSVRRSRPEGANLASMGLSGRRRHCADALFPVFAGAILSPIIRRISIRRISKKVFADSLIFQQEVTGKSADERRSHHRVGRQIELFDQSLRYRWRIPRNGDRRDLPVDNLRPLR